MVSIIIPYWNAEKWIQRCVESVKQQEGDFECIFINDGSTDNSEAIIKQSADERFVMVDNKHLKGVSGARNTGLDIAKGDWVTFLDADDTLTENAMVIFGHMIALDETINILQANHLRHYVETGKTILKYPTNPGRYCMNNLPECWCMVWNKLIRRSFIEEHEIRFVEGLQYGEDEIFVLDLLSHDDRILNTKKNTTTVLRYFDNKESLSRVKDKEGLIEQARALEDFILRCKNPRARLQACEVLAEHWNSPTYRKAFGSMKYIIMCGGDYDEWETPKQMTEVNGEELVARTIKLLRANGIKDISISSNDARFEKYGVPVLRHNNEYHAKDNGDIEGWWHNCFYPTDEPTCYIFGDVYFSPEAIKKIVNTPTEDIEFFGSAKPFSPFYIKQYVEPFAFKVWNTDILREACEKVETMECWRNPISWEVWDTIKGYPIDKPHRNRKDYVIINDYTCDVDCAEDAQRLSDAIKQANR